MLQKALVLSPWGEPRIVASGRGPDTLGPHDYEEGAKGYSPAGPLSSWLMVVPALVLLSQP